MSAIPELLISWPCQDNLAKLSLAKVDCLRNDNQRLHATRCQPEKDGRVRQAAENAARSLREDILSGAIAGGTRLGEAELAGRLSVSRTPIREALSRLAAEGLIDLQPNRGARVATWSADELHEIFELRLRLEPYAVRLAVPHITAEDLATMSELAESMLRVGRPGGKQDLTAIVELNRRFHGQFIAAAGSAPLAAALRGVTHAAVVHQNFHDYTPDALRRSLNHHLEMVAAVRAGDGDWAEAIMRAHLYNARATMLGGRA